MNDDDFAESRADGRAEGCARSRAYHHGDLRKTLLEACCKHIECQGTEGLSLRALAREAGVSATAPYRHFDNRQALLAALASEGFRELAGRIEGVPAADPIEALFYGGLAYVRYAEANPVKYHLMFGDVIGDFSDHAELLEAACDCYARLEAILEAGLASGSLRCDSLPELGGTVWALLHGLSGLVITARTKAAQMAPEVVAQVAPLCAQQRVADAPERVLLRLIEGLVADPSSLRHLQKKWRGS